MTVLLSDITTPSDAELISSVRGGDVAAYGELFARHRHAANRLARQLVRGPDADDLVSEAFAKVLSVLRGGGGPDVAFRAYLLTAVRRLHVDKMRAGARVQASDDLTAFDPGVPFVDTAVASFESSAAAQAFATLPERWQLVLWHLEVEGEKPADIAPLLGMSANSVSALAYRAREGLRQAFLTMHLNDISDSDCRWVGDHLGAFVRKGLSKRDSTKMRTHLDQCRRCSAMHLELTDVNSNLAAIIAPLLLGAAATGYLASTGAVSAGGLGLLTIVGRVRDVVVANAGAATASGVAASVAAAATAGVMLTPSEERVIGADRPVDSTSNAAPEEPGAPVATGGPSSNRPVTEDRSIWPVETPTALSVVILPVAILPVALPTGIPFTERATDPEETPTPTPEPTPSPEPTSEPSLGPSQEPSGDPSGEPGAEPSGEPSAAPTPVTPAPPVVPVLEADLTVTASESVLKSLGGSYVLQGEVSGTSGVDEFELRMAGPAAVASTGTPACSVTGVDGDVTRMTCRPDGASSISFAIELTRSDRSAPVDVVLSSALPAGWVDSGPGADLVTATLAAEPGAAPFGFSVGPTVTFLGSNQYRLGATISGIPEAVSSVSVSLEKTGSGGQAPAFLTLADPDAGCTIAGAVLSCPVSDGVLVLSGEVRLPGFQPGAYELVVSAQEQKLRKVIDEIVSSVTGG